MLRQCGNRGSASELSWLSVWTLADLSNDDSAGRVGAITNHSGSAGERGFVSEDLANSETATLSTFDEELLAWSQSGTDQCNTTQNTAHDVLPSASLDANQLIDWFGTDLNTSTFDFDGNLQYMI